ncbi:uncharacterized protein V6R79_013913 [Siganus canaliculatus]
MTNTLLQARKGKLSGLRCLTEKSIAISSYLRKFVSLDWIYMTVLLLLRLLEDISECSVTLYLLFIAAVLLRIMQCNLNGSAQLKVAQLAAGKAALGDSLPHVLSDECKETLFTVAGLAQVTALRCVCGCRAASDICTSSPALT